MAASPSIAKRSVVSIRMAAAVAAALASAGAARGAPIWDGADGPGWPKAVEKKLHASDFRNKKAPELNIEEYLSPRPESSGKVVLVCFWTTYSSQSIIPQLNKLQERHKNDLVVYGLTDEQPDVVRSFMKTTELKFTVAVDTKGRAKKAVKVTGIPHVLAISTDGIVRWQGYPWSPEEPLTEEIIGQIIEADPGVKARREAEAAKKEDPAEAPGGEQPAVGKPPETATPAPAPTPAPKPGG